MLEAGYRIVVLHDRSACEVPGGGKVAVMGDVARRTIFVAGRAPVVMIVEGMAAAVRRFERIEDDPCPPLAG